MLAEVPCPRPGLGQLLIRSHTSLVSAGAERMMVKICKAGLIDKPRPDRSLGFFWKYHIMHTYFLPVRSAARPGRGYSL